jgi:hypothetical protein
MAIAVQIDKHRTGPGNIRAAASSPLLTAEDVAAITGLSIETLAQWRRQPFLKLSRNVVRTAMARFSSSRWGKRCIRSVLASSV